MCSFENLLTKLRINVTRIPLMNRYSNYCFETNKIQNFDRNNVKDLIVAFNGFRDNFF
jgi:hypothetical protein